MSTTPVLSQTAESLELQTSGDLIPLRRFRCRNLNSINKSTSHYEKYSIPLGFDSNGAYKELVFNPLNYKKGRHEPEFCAYDFPADAKFPESLPSLANQSVYEFLLKSPCVLNGDFFEDEDFHIQSQLEINKQKQTKNEELLKKQEEILKAQEELIKSQESDIVKNDEVVIIKTTSSKQKKGINIETNQV